MNRGSQGGRPHGDLEPRDRGPAARHLPWIDGLAGLIAGLVVLVAHRPLAQLYDLPGQLVLFVGAANVGYATLGLTLGPMRSRSPRLLTTLVIANYAWTVVCVVLAIAYARQASLFGLAHLLLEGGFVATLATLERRHRHAILGRDEGQSSPRTTARADSPP